MPVDRRTPHMLSQQSRKPARKPNGRDRWFYATIVSPCNWRRLVRVLRSRSAVSEHYQAMQAMGPIARPAGGQSSLRSRRFSLRTISMTT
jgi:hypothetical protein